MGKGPLGVGWGSVLRALGSRSFLAMVEGEAHHVKNGLAVALGVRDGGQLWVLRGPSFTSKMLPPRRDEETGPR